MKKYSIMFLVPLIALLLSSCSMHLGLRKLLNSSSPQPTKTKHIKATHTPPSPPTATPAGAGGALTPTPLAGNVNPITSASDQPGSLPVKVSSAVIGTRHSAALQPVPSS